MLEQDLQECTVHAKITISPLLGVPTESLHSFASVALLESFLILLYAQMEIFDSHKAS